MYFWRKGKKKVNYIKESAMHLQIARSIILYSDAATETMGTSTQCDAIM